MRAKRSKKYRKIMEAYALAFSFHEPYQVLLDAAFIRTCHAFHMPLRQYLENTLHGQSRFMVTQCTLAKIMRDHTKSGVKTSRPDFLPPPTELPLRYCKHEEKGDEWGEVDCLIDLIGGMPKGNELKKNKWRFILATADPNDRVETSRDTADLRLRARFIPGVPIVYVKRSVMVLEELSGATLAYRKDQEKEKLKEGIVGGRKRKREDAYVDGEEGVLDDLVRVEGGERTVTRGMQRSKGPNPLSVRKKKSKAPEQEEAAKRIVKVGGGDDKGSTAKPKRKRKHGSNQAANSGTDETADGVENVLTAHSRLQEAVA